MYFPSKCTEWTLYTYLRTRRLKLDKHSFFAPILFFYLKLITMA